jgi:hypothetical protein
MNPGGKTAQTSFVADRAPFTQFEAELEQHMIEQYQKHSKLNGFKPTVSKKDKEFSPK